MNNPEELPQDDAGGIGMRTSLPSSEDIAKLLKKHNEIDGDSSGGESSDSSDTSTVSSDDSSLDSDFSDEDWAEGLIDLDLEDRINVVGSTPALAAMIFGDRNKGEGGNSQIKSKHNYRGDTDVQSLASFVATGSDDSSVLSNLLAQSTKSFEMRRNNSDVIIQSADYSSKATDDTIDGISGELSVINGIDVQKPDDFLQQLLVKKQKKDKKKRLSGNGGNATATATTNDVVNNIPSPLSADDAKLDNFFLPMKEENIAAYNQDIATAARSGNLKFLRKQHEEGKNLQCCNKFHETIIHTICRRGHANLLKYAIEEVKLNIRLRCDYGRNPLHDACWTDKPNFELVKLLLTECPDLLYIKDSRGFTPLSYVGKQLWYDWCQFLEENKNLIQPKELF